MITLAQTTETEEIFANNFWGLKDDGFFVLTAKMNSTKRTFDEIKSFYNTRASLHEDFGRKLMKHAKTGMGREETGTLHALLSSAHKEMEWTAQAHLNLAQKIKARLEVDLDNFILEQKDKRKLTHTSVEKAHRYKQSSEAYLSKVKEKYESDCAKLITMQSQIGSLSGREADRMKQRIERTQHEIKVQEQEYKNACIKSADATESWNRIWKMTCDTYQGMEKKRLDFLHHSFSMYINVLSTATSQDQESYERFWKSLDQYDPIKDIQVFIHEKGTGPKIPEPEIFVDYMDDPAKTFQKHTIANFPVPQEFDRPKPDLTVRNPTITAAAPNPSNSTLLQRGKSLHQNKTQNEVIIEPPTPSKSTTERRKSIIRGIIKPLPSISTSSIKQKAKSRNASSNENSSNRKTNQQQAPVITVPDISSSSTTTDISDYEDNSPIRTDDKNKEEEGDITIDPRAKVVFAIGNNMFDLGHLDLDDKGNTNDKKTDKKGSILNGRGLTATRRMTTRRRQTSADLDAACNFSYQSLLEELGVFEGDKSNKNRANGPQQRKKTEDGTLDNDNARDTVTKSGIRLSTRRSQHKSISHPPLSQQQQQQHQPIVGNDNLNQISPVSAIPSNQEMYNVNSINNDAYIQARQQQQQQIHHNLHLQQQQQQQQQMQLQQQQQMQLNQQYYKPYTATAAAPPANMVNQSYCQPSHSKLVNDTYQPPPNIAESGQSILFWVLALGEWYTGKTEELQFARGTWLAVTEVRTDGWYYAIKFDSRLNSLTNEKGFVAQNYVQVYT